MKINWDKIEQYIIEGYINYQKHNTVDLWIYNYTAKCQYSNYWNNETLSCRGLIRNAKFTIIARPFKKIFNMAEEKEIPNESYDVYEKLDGSLGILYFIKEKPYIATRGSFHSPQAEFANSFLYKNIDYTQFDSSYTYLFEIIYPENRIIVNYQNKEDLILLAKIHTITGKEESIEKYICSKEKKYFSNLHIKDIDFLFSIPEKNKEGFVLHYKPSNKRIKLKFNNYLKLHKLKYSLSDKIIIEYAKQYVKTGIDFILKQNELIDDLFYKEILDKYNNYIMIYRKIVIEIESFFKKITITNLTRKEIASIIITHKYKSILFAKLDNKNIENLIWDTIKKIAFQKEKK